MKAEEELMQKEIDMRRLRLLEKLEGLEEDEQQKDQQ